MNRAWIIAPTMGIVGILIAGALWLRMNAYAPSATTTTVEPTPTAPSPKPPVTTAPEVRRTAQLPVEPQIVDRPSIPLRPSYPEIDRLQTRLDGILQTHLDLSDLRDDATAEEADDHMRGLTSDLSVRVQSLAREYRQIGGSIERRSEALNHAAHLYEHLATEIEHSEMPRGLSPDEADEYQQSKHRLVDATRSKANVLREEVQMQ